MIAELSFDEHMYYEAAVHTYYQYTESSMSIKVVVVDDHPAIRRLMRQLLSQSKEIRVVAEAGSGMEALECIRTYSPDVITLDMMMGDMTGLEVLAKLRTLVRRPKVVAVSLYDAPQLVQRALDAGADAYIPKRELSPQRLVETVQAVVMSGSVNGR